MTEAEVLEVLSGFANNTATYFTMFVSFTFAYVTVAYFVGKNLSTFQCLAISGLYLISAFVAGWTTIGWAHAWLVLQTRETTIIDEVWLFNAAGWIGITTILLSMISLVSLYFMYDVRRERTP